MSSVLGEECLLSAHTIRYVRRLFIVDAEEVQVLSCSCRKNCVYAGLSAIFHVGGYRVQATHYAVAQAISEALRRARVVPIGIECWNY